MKYVIMDQDEYEVQSGILKGTVMLLENIRSQIGESYGITKAIKNINDALKRLTPVEISEDAEGLARLFYTELDPVIDHDGSGVERVASLLTAYADKIRRECGVRREIKDAGAIELNDGMDN